MTIAEEKQAQRTAGRAARKALAAPQRAAANAALCRRVLELDAYRTAHTCLLYTSPSPRDRQKSRMPSSA